MFRYAELDRVARVQIGDLFCHSDGIIFLYAQVKCFILIGFLNRDAAVSTLDL